MAYNFNGKRITALNRLVLEVVKRYVNEHPEITYSELKKIFRDEIGGGSRGIIKNKEDFEEWQQKIKDPERRFFIRDEESIKLKDDVIYVNQGWGGDWTDGKTKEIKRGNKDKFLTFVKDELKYKIDSDNIDEENNYLEIEEKVDKENNINIKNIMLYGAPGVGKTHNYKRLITMIENGEDEKTIFDMVAKNEATDSFYDATFETIKKEKRIEFVTFHQGYSYEDFIEGFRPNKNGEIELKNGVFKNIVNEINTNYTELSFDEIIELYKKFILTRVSTHNYLGQEIIRGYHLADNYINYNNLENSKYYIDINNGINIIFRSIGSGHTSLLELSDIKMLYTQYNYIKNNNFSLDIISKLLFGNNINDSNDNDKIYYIYDIVSFVNSLKDFIENKIVQQKQNFYIVIDEINRGNISKIFGELITLIEEDKRDNYEVTLPYSKEKFKIPSNLYIIATMNSTDKSIATIDIALRRRFTFLKMKPNIDLVPENAKELFKNLNEFIANTLGEDYKIGHSYFMQGLDLEFVKKYKIQPLLEEYFYGDEVNYKKAITILGLENE